MSREWGFPLGPQTVATKATLTSPTGTNRFSTQASRSSPQQIQQWIEQYGPVITLTTGEGIHVIIGRHQILSRGMKFMQMSTCDLFRMYRKAAHSELQMKAMLIYDNDQTQYAHNIVFDILKQPASHQGHINRFSATMTLRVIYGKTTPTYLNDSCILHLQRMVPIVQSALMPGAYKVVLKYVPGYTWELDRWANLEHEQFINNVRQTKKGLDDHTKPHSVAGALLAKPAMGMSEDEMVYFCGSLVGASYDTTQVSISTILMAAADIQEIVQTEIDSVVGRETFACIHLRITALETTHWASLTVLSGCISRDPEVFPDPETFDINHWIDQDGILNDLFRLWAEDMTRAQPS
ncbi:cytochrome P450 [Melanogaster broomeanus]|nr:cytochrome P450 [Melanogaster broomeanus]